VIYIRLEDDPLCLAYHGQHHGIALVVAIGTDDQINFAWRGILLAAQRQTEDGIGRQGWSRGKDGHDSILLVFHGLVKWILGSSLLNVDPNRATTRAKPSQPATNLVSNVMIYAHHQNFGCHTDDFSASLAQIPRRTYSPGEYGVPVQQIFGLLLLGWVVVAIGGYGCGDVSRQSIIWMSSGVGFAQHEW
jgi:hypothetical protein